jgi:hypothetical protein
MTIFKALKQFSILIALLPSLALSEEQISVDERISKLIAEAKLSCISDGGVLELSGDEVVKYDLNNDGNTDLAILNELEYDCSSSASLFQGTAGAVIHLITDVDYSYGYARQYKFIKAFNDVPTVLFYLHGISCDEVGLVPCINAVSIYEGRFVRNRKL